MKDHMPERPLQPPEVPPMSNEERWNIEMQAMDEISKPEWWTEVSQEIAEQLALICEAYESRASDETMARLARYLVLLARDYEIERDE